MIITIVPVDIGSKRINEGNTKGSNKSCASTPNNLIADTFQRTKSLKKGSISFTGGSPLSLAEATNNFDKLLEELKVANKEYLAKLEEASQILNDFGKVIKNAQKNIEEYQLK